MQTKLTAKRIFAAVMTVIMMLTFIPFSAFAADEAPEYVMVGTYNNAPLRWQVLKTNADGSKLLIYEDALKNGTSAVKFGSKTTVLDFATSDLYTLLNETFYDAAFSTAEKAAIVDTTITYTNKTSDAATATGKVVVPTVADVTTYGLTKASAEYWLADWSATTTIATMKTTGSVGKKATNQTASFRPVITVKGDQFVTLTAAEGVSYTSVNDKAITLALVGSSFKVALDANYSESAITVKANGAVITAADGVYTATASPITVEGVAANPANYTAYNEAVAAANELVKEDYSAETWAAVEEALAADVAGLTFADQAKVDAAAKAINDAVAALKPAPADFTAYNKALADAQYCLDNPNLFQLDEAADEGGYLSYKTKFTQAINASANILTYTKDKQAEVDAAAEELAGYVAAIPYKSATITAWKKCIEDAAKITEDKYEADYVAAVKAIVAEVVAEHDYEADPVTALYQADVDAAAKKMRDVIGDQVFIDSKLLKADFSALDAALERAATYVETNYYKDEEVKHEKELGGTAAWTQFAGMKAEAERVAATKENNPTKIAAQKGIDEATANLIKAMDELDPFIKLEGWDRFVKDVKFFFEDVKYTIDGIIDLLKTLGGLLGMLFRGEIDIAGLIEML